MKTLGTTPVLVGVGQALQRLEEPQIALEPLGLMQGALDRAYRDSGAPSLLERTTSFYVVRGAWGYADPGRELARRFGVPVQETIDTPYGGNYAQACVLDAARAIQEGDTQVSIITGAENSRSQGQAQRMGVSLKETEAPGHPDRAIAEAKAIFHEAEIARGMNSASDIFALVESAIRFAKGETLEAHERRIAELWAGFNVVARDNPNAWLRLPLSAQDIGLAGPDNPMISYPYTRRMNANARVDMGASLVVCSLDVARKSGVPDEKLVFLHSGTEANDSNFLSTRMDFQRSPAMHRAGARALELAGQTIEEIDHFDLYSCFPSAVQVAATELGIPEGRRLTVTGGLTFGGGPLNSYTLHAIARMVEVVRENPKSTGLVSGNGGWLAKHAFGIYSTLPPVDGFRYENVQAQLQSTPLREAVVDWKGPVTIEAYTVAHQKGEPRLAHVACLTEKGARTFATTDDHDLREMMMREEFCGKPAEIDGRGNLRMR